MRSLRVPDATLAERAVVGRSLPVLRLSPAICSLPAIRDAKGSHVETGADQHNADPMCLRLYVDATLSN